MSPGPRRNSLKKKTRGKKSRGTVPLRNKSGSKKEKQEEDVESRGEKQEVRIGLG